MERGLPIENYRKKEQKEWLNNTLPDPHPCISGNEEEHILSSEIINRKFNYDLTSRGGLMTPKLSVWYWFKTPPPPNMWCRISENLHVVNQLTVTGNIKRQCCYNELNT